MERLDIIKSYYEPKIIRGQPDFKILGWESGEAQNMRFDVLLSNVPVEGKKLLDVGCGVGSLYGYITSKGKAVEYTGVDILEKMIELAKEKNPGVEFLCTDIFGANPFGRRTFDIIYASGIFNLDLGNNRSFLSHALTRFYGLAKEYVVFNLLHHKSPGKEPGYFYYSPEEVPGIISDAGLEFSKVHIVENYLNNDFSVICTRHS